MDQSQQNYPKFDAQYQYQYGAIDLKKPMTVGQFMIVLFLLIIPVVNIIMLLTWAFGSNSNVNKKNYARAILIYTLLIIVFSTMLFIIFGSSIMQIINNTRYFSQ